MRLLVGGVDLPSVVLYGAVGALELRRVAGVCTGGLVVSGDCMRTQGVCRADRPGGSKQTLNLRDRWDGAGWRLGAQRLNCGYGARFYGMMGSGAHGGAKCHVQRAKLLQCNLFGRVP